MKSRSLRALVALLAVLAIVGAACGDDDDDGGAAGGATEQKGRIVVGSTNFSEQQIVANMYALVLEHAGYDISRKLNLGTREVVEPALESGDIDLYPEYIGTALEFLNKGAGEATGDTDETAAKLRERFESRGVSVLEPAPAQDQNALVVTPETAEKYGLEKVSDLSDVADQLVFGGPPECPERPFCLPGYKETYGLEFKDFKPLDVGGPITKQALENGDIDVALLFSSDGGIAARGWKVLEDDKELQAADNVVPVIRTEVLDDDVKGLLNGLSEKLTTDELSELNRQVDEDKKDPEDVAQAWLKDQGLL